MNKFGVYDIQTTFDRFTIQQMQQQQDQHQQRNKKRTNNEKFMSGHAYTCDCDYTHKHSCSCCESTTIIPTCVSFVGTGFCEWCAEQQLKSFDQYVKLGSIRPPNILTNGTLSLAETKALKLAMIADYTMLCFDKKITVTPKLDLFVFGTKDANTKSSLPALNYDIYELIGKSMYQGNCQDPCTIGKGDYVKRIKTATRCNPVDPEVRQTFDPECFYDAAVCVSCMDVKRKERDLQRFQCFIVASGYEKCRLCSSHRSSWNERQTAEYTQFVFGGYGFYLDAKMADVRPRGLTFHFMDYIFMRKYVRDNFLLADPDTEGGEEKWTPDEIEAYDSDDVERENNGLPPKRNLQNRIERNKKRKCF